MPNNSPKKSVKSLHVLVLLSNKESRNCKDSFSRKSRKYLSWSIKSKRNISLTANSIKSSLIKKCKRKNKPRKIRMAPSFKIQIRINKKSNKAKSKKFKTSPKRYMLWRKNPKIDLDSKSEAILKMMND